MRRTFFIGSLLLAMTTSAMGAQVYKWVDDKGITHFGAQPPAGIDASTVNTSTAQPKPGFPLPAAQAPALPPSEDDKQKAVDEQVKRDIAKKDAERDKYCDGLRTDLAQLKNNPRLRIQEKNGEMRRLAEEERQARITETEQAIRKDCD